MPVRFSTYMQLIPYESDQQRLLRYDIALLDSELAILEADIAAFHDALYAFDREYQKRLGDLADAVRELRREHGIEEHQDNTPAAITELADEHFAYLKSAYRQAAKLCHPDQLDKQHLDIGLALFDALNKAYHLQDIVTVAHILWLLQSGQAFQETPVVITCQDLLEQRKELLELMIVQYRDQLDQLKMREDYDASNRDNWNILLYDYQTQLEDELAMFRSREKHKKKLSQ